VFQSVPIGSGTGTEHQWKEPDYVFFEPFLPSLLVSTYIDELSPEPSLLQAKQFLPSQPFLL